MEKAMNTKPGLACHIEDLERAERWHTNKLNYIAVSACPRGYEIVKRKTRLKSGWDNESASVAVFEAQATVQGPFFCLDRGQK
jgi:hypothetical protein